MFCWYQGDRIDQQTDGLWIVQDSGIFYNDLTRKVGKMCYVILKYIDNFYSVFLAHQINFNPVRYDTSCHVKYSCSFVQ